MAFHITGLDPAPFRHLWGADAADLRREGVQRFTVDATPGFPDRITLSDAPMGATVLLMNHVSQPAASPYYASHAIFVQEGAEDRFEATDTLPPVFLARPQSLRAFDTGGMMRMADLAEGADIKGVIARFFDDPDVAEVHAHNARQGCFNARITRG